MEHLKRSDDERAARWAEKTLRMSVPTGLSGLRVLRDGDPSWARLTEVFEQAFPEFAAFRYFREDEPR